MSAVRPGATTEAIRAFVAGYRCPDCDSTTTLRRIVAGIYDVEIAHDPTCPWLARMENR